jgi:predicted fused transcriptional regulator/phosphomethylpyrimidine kinase
MTKEPEEIGAIEDRVREIQEAKRGRMRWTASRHTAELALVAVVGEAKSRRPSPKGRRRKRKKRLL